MAGTGQGMQAYQAASKKLRDAHADEFSAALVAERVALGLPPIAGVDIASLEKRIERQEQRLTELRAKYAAATNGSPGN